jgi:hypothetical protein
MLRVVLLLPLALALAGQDTRPNFSGVWRVDQLHSTGREEAEAIDHKGSSCRVTFYYSQADVVPSVTYITGGKDTESSRSRAAHAHWEGATLVIDESVIQGTEHSVHITMALSGDGKILTKRLHYSPSGVDQDATIVFNKISTNVTLGRFQVGASMADVKNAWGEPDQAIESGTQTIFVYRNWRCGRVAMCSHRLIFLDGKFVESQYGR